MESKTPRTDSQSRIVKHTTYYMGAALTDNVEVVDASFARKLETELAEARDEIERLEIRLSEQQERATFGHTATAAAVKLECYKRINAKNELIKQMWEAIKNALQSADAEWENKNQGHDWAEACETMRVALEAAERGE